MPIFGIIFDDTNAAAWRYTLQPPVCLTFQVSDDRRFNFFVLLFFTLVAKEVIKVRGFNKSSISITWLAKVGTRILPQTKISGQNGLNLPFKAQKWGLNRAILAHHG